MGAVMSRVLIVDDDTELCEMLVEYLGTEGFFMDTVHDGAAGVELGLSGEYDIVVLDVMLPKINGFDVLRHIRTESQVPILMLTAREDDVDRIVGLEVGADDYLSKPCNPRELVARLRAILRRTRYSQSNPESRHDRKILQAGDMEVHPALRQAIYRKHKLDLTSTEYNLLEVLVRNAGQVVTKKTLSEQALGRKLTRYDRSVDMHLSKLRRKLGTDEEGLSPIQTVRGVGYQFTGV